MLAALHHFQFVMVSQELMVIQELIALHHHFQPVALNTEDFQEKTALSDKVQLQLVHSLNQLLLLLKNRSQHALIDILLTANQFALNLKLPVALSLELQPHTH